MDDLLNHPRDKRRLPDCAYAVPGSAWHITIGTHDPGSRPLSEPNLALHLGSSLAESARYHSAILHLWCVMPTHAHVIIEVREIDLRTLVKSMKMWSTRVWWKLGGEGYSGTRASTITASGDNATSTPRSATSSKIPSKRDSSKHGKIFPLWVARSCQVSNRSKRQLWPCGAIHRHGGRWLRRKRAYASTSAVSPYASTSAA